MFGLEIADSVNTWFERDSEKNDVLTKEGRMTLINTQCKTVHDYIVDM